ncbi:hypothetical protein CLOP_g24434 [Closterium sp. NIES-67]|nr:hypothetical protein CLOP_g24434 [Closterium sp. NIES-67]
MERERVRLQEQVRKADRDSHALRGRSGRVGGAVAGAGEGATGSNLPHGKGCAREERKSVEIQRRLGEEYQAAMDGQNRLQAMLEDQGKRVDELTALLSQKGLECKEFSQKLISAKEEGAGVQGVFTKADFGHGR